MCVCLCVIFQQAAYHPEVNNEVQMRALRYGSECASGYLGLLEHVLVVRGGALTLCRVNHSESAHTHELEWSKKAKVLGLGHSVSVGWNPAA